MAKRTRRLSLASGNFYTDVIKDSRQFDNPKRVDDLDLLEPVTRKLVEAIIPDALANGLKLMVFET
jgi:hypothetical protein